MKRPNNITISLPQKRLEQLESLSHKGESIGQTAKRLLLEILDGDGETIAEDQLEPLNKRIETLEMLLNSKFEQVTKEIEAIVSQVEVITPKQTPTSDKQTPTSDKPPTSNKQTPASNKQNKSRLPKKPQGLTSPQLAEHLGVNRSTVTRWTKKGYDPSGAWVWRDGFWFAKN